MATGLRWQNARLKPHTVEKAREPSRVALSPSPSLMDGKRMDWSPELYMCLMQCPRTTVTARRVRPFLISSDTLTCSNVGALSTSGLTGAAPLYTHLPEMFAGQHHGRGRCTESWQPFRRGPLCAIPMSAGIQGPRTRT